MRGYDLIRYIMLTKQKLKNLLPLFLVKNNSNNKLNFFMIFKFQFMYFYSGLWPGGALTLGQGGRGAIAPCTPSLAWLRDACFQVFSYLSKNKNLKIRKHLEVWLCKICRFKNIYIPKIIWQFYKLCVSPSVNLSKKIGRFSLFTN